MPESNDKNSPPTLLHLWRRGKLAERPGFATIVLAAVLILTLGAAQLLVMPHADRYAAMDNAAELLDLVRSQGLQHYLGDQPRTNFLLRELDGKPIGFQAITFRPERTEDGRLVYRGRELIYFEGEGGLQAAFRVANDLSSFEYELIEPVALRDTAGRFHRARALVSLTNGRLNYVFITRGEKNVVPVPYDPHAALIPLFLADLFTSLTATETAEPGAAFAIPAPQEVFQTHNPFVTYWITPGSDLPARVREQNPQGHAASARNLDSDFRQQLYYGPDRQLIWQKDFTEPPAVLRSVSSSQLIERFPEARPLIRALEVQDGDERQQDQPEDRIIL